MHYHWGQAAAKKERDLFEQRTSSKKSSVTLVITTAEWFIQLFLNLVNLKGLFDVGTKLKGSISKINNQINSTVTTRAYGFCQQNRLVRGQVQDCYLDEKMAVVSVCLNGRYCSLGCEYCMALTKMKAMSIFLFQLSKEMLPVQFF